MSTKLPRKTLPQNHTKADFKCSGPPAIKDGDFDHCMIADLGCFNQDGSVDSNKFYHGAVVQSTKTSVWYTYYEWGRTGQSADFLFSECGSKEEAQREMAKQLLSKNLKRGEWKTIAGLQVLRPKIKGDGTPEDLYLVRPVAKRTTGLPDAQQIIHDDRTVKPNSSSSAATKKKSTKKSSKVDSVTLELMRAFNVASINYTRANISGGHIPTKSAIDQARDILIEATKRVGNIGNDINSQTKDKELRDLTAVMYSIIPKIKRLHAPDSEWILSGDNIQAWQLDVDAFENALFAIDVENNVDNDPFGGMNIDMRHIPDDFSTVEGQLVYKWMPLASANKHSHVGNMKILNIWAFRQKNLVSRFNNKLTEISSTKIKPNESPLFQPQNRLDISDSERKLFEKSHTALLFHGTRTVNCSGILREGLRLPKHLSGVVLTGAMWGPGTYFADDWRKSDGYTSRQGTYWASGGGGIKNRGAFMFAADVILGNPHIPSGSYGFSKAPTGCHSVGAIGRRSGVQNNEWIVYDTSQVNLRYLVEYETRRN